MAVIAGGEAQATAQHPFWAGAERMVVFCEARVADPALRSALCDHAPEIAIAALDDRIGLPAARGGDDRTPGPAVVVLDLVFGPVADIEGATRTAVLARFRRAGRDQPPPLVAHIVDPHDADSLSAGVAASIAVGMPTRPARPAIRLRPPEE